MANCTSGVTTRSSSVVNVTLRRYVPDIVKGVSGSRGIASDHVAPGPSSIIARTGGDIGSVRAPFGRADPRLTVTLELSGRVKTYAGTTSFSSGSGTCRDLSV